MNYFEYFLLRQKYWMKSFFDSISAPINDSLLFYDALLLTLVYFVFEQLFKWRKEQKTLRKYLFSDLFHTVFNLLLFWYFVGFALTDFINHVIDDSIIKVFGATHKEVFSIKNAPNWMQVILLFLFFDFLNYWVHRISHRVNFMWVFHKVHHSSKEIDIINGMRFHFLDLLFYPLLIYIPLSLVGFNTRDFYLVFVFTNILSLFSHANVNFSYGPLKYLFNSPKFHIWHHAKKIKGYNYGVNFGSALSIWDFLFNTAYYKNEFNPKNDDLGLENENYPDGFLKQMLKPFREILTFRNTK